MSSFKGGVPTILVVEDSDDTRAIIRLELERWGYTVAEARNGREAIEMMERLCPDLILMDLNMPEVDGLTAAETIRRYDDRCAGVPIIAITAYDTFGIEEAAREAGCDAYIRKPLDMPHLEKTVSGFLYG
ncbi:MAG: response regulator [Acidobacteriota bacterium]|nr:response regulator [Acidobacteriota bacterium]